MNGLLVTSRAIDDMRTKLRSHGVPTFRVSTMTWSARFDGFDDIARHDVSQIQSMENTEGFTSQRSKFSKSAVALGTPGSSISVKLFGRGSVHVTGCKTVDDVKSILERVGRLLQRMYDIPHFPVLEIAKLNMINVQAAWPHQIDLRTFAASVRARGGYAEEPEKPPTVIVRLPNDGDATAFAYRSGKFVISGKTPEAVTRILSFVAALQRHQANVEIAETPPTKVAMFSREYTTFTM